MNSLGLLVGLSQPVLVLLVEGSIWIGFLSLNILEGGLVAVIEHDLFVHQVLEVFLGERVLLEVKVEG